MFVIAGVVACSLSDVGNHILQAINETGITVPASANYVAPIESLVCSAFLILSLVGVIRIVVTLLKLYDNLTA